MTAQRNTPGPLMVATGNAHKLTELRAMLAPYGFAVEPAPEGFTAVEDGETFTDNAAIKVRAMQRLLGQTSATSRGQQLPVPWLLADDSGLVVPALGGAPGVHSARYAAPTAGVNADAANRAKLLTAMDGLRGPERRGYFVCVLALVGQDGALQTFTGEVHGHIAQQPLGSSGFGYDAVFCPEGSAQTFAQAGSALKQQLSHRARALTAMLRTFHVSVTHSDPLRS